MDSRQSIKSSTSGRGLRYTIITALPLLYNALYSRPVQGVVYLRGDSMERITFKSEINGNYLIPSSKLEVHGELADKLGYLEDLEDDYRLILIHFKSGDSVYYVTEPDAFNGWKVWKGKILKATVTEDFEVYYFYTAYGFDEKKFNEAELGRRFFKNEQEAKDYCKKRTQID